MKPFFLRLRIRGIYRKAPWVKRLNQPVNLCALSRRTESFKHNHDWNALAFQLPLQKGHSGFKFFHTFLVRLFVHFFRQINFLQHTISSFPGILNHIKIVFLILHVSCHIPESHHIHSF